MSEHLAVQTERCEVKFKRILRKKMKNVILNASRDLQILPGLKSVAMLIKYRVGEGGCAEIFGEELCWKIATWEH
jgi:hypothetical protein